MSFTEDIRKTFGIVLSNEQIELFEKYYELLIEYNKHTNLTTITNKEEVYYKHFFDSLTLINHLTNKEGYIVDMGSGAGFPSIPLKILFPTLKVTIIDSLNKRITFLNELINRLNLNDVLLIHGRIEEVALKSQEKYDYATARALGNMTLITEMSLPMLKVGGSFLAMKSANVKEELLKAKSAIKTLGGKIVNEMYLELPNNYGSRSIIEIEKERHIKGYPRRYSQMVKNPL